MADRSKSTSGDWKVLDRSISASTPPSHLAIKRKWSFPSDEGDVKKPRLDQWRETEARFRQWIVY